MLACLASAVASVALLALAIPPISAQALSSPTPEFGDAHGIAVDQETGDFYVVDSANNRVDEFAATGIFIRAWGWGVANGASELQTCTANCKAGIAGAGPGQFSNPTGVVVDNSSGPSQGDVYVLDRNNGRVAKFDSDGALLLEFSVSGQALAIGPTGTLYLGENESVQKYTPGGTPEGLPLTLEGVGEITALAVDGSGELYVEASGTTGVHKYGATGTELAVIEMPPSGVAGAMALGPSGELFVEDSHEGTNRILEYKANGEEVESFDTRPEAEAEVEASRGLAFGQGTNDLYLLSKESVSIVPLPAPGPVVVEDSEKALPASASCLLLHATVNPEGYETAYEFDYGTTVAYGYHTPNQIVPSGFEEEEASAEVCALSPATTYHYRIVASNECEKGSRQQCEASGDDEAFTTQPVAPSISGESVSGVTEAQALLEAEIDPGGEATYYFEYGTTTCEANTCGTKTAPEYGPLTGDAEEAVSFELKGLKANTTYHYWAVAKNAKAPSGIHGEPEEFKTPESQAEKEAWFKTFAEENAKRVAEEAATKEAAKKHEEEAATAASNKHQEEEAAANKQKATEPPTKPAIKKPLTRAQKLEAALKACHAKHGKKRTHCVASARRTYGRLNAKRKPTR
jgi:DNA-binding beta-propeller fold protein YncE